MQQNYSRKTDPIQKATKNTASSVLDASSQSEALQRKADMASNAAQREEAPRPNNTGMPDNLKSGIESLSGFSMDDVRVHYNSSKPATVQALAYTQGTDIHIAPGQEKHLPHEAWHVAQQMAGRVSPTTNINGMPVNDNAGLEHEADVMGEKAVQCKNEFDSAVEKKNGCMALQRMSFAASPLAVNTLQWESKGTPWHEKPGQRDEALSILVDQYKKEMLTCIAKKIEESASKKKLKCGPHISVVITGGVWYISVNSEVYGESYVTDLKRCAEEVFQSLSEGWNNIKIYRGPKEAQAEAAFIALRWAVSRGRSIEIITNRRCEPSSAKHVHAEMQTLNTLNGRTLKWLTDDEKEQKMKAKLSAIDEETIEQWKKMKEGKKRVVRVGGTKTPCFDCFYEMGGVIDGKDGYKLVNLAGYTGTYKITDQKKVLIDSVKPLTKAFLGQIELCQHILEKFECTTDNNGRKYFGLKTENSRVFYCVLFPNKDGTCRGTLYEKIKGDFSRSDTKDGCDLHNVPRVSAVKNRLVTTMTHEHGPASGTWCFSSASSIARISDYFESETTKIEQDQKYEDLKQACILLGVTL